MSFDVVAGALSMFRLVRIQRDLRPVNHTGSKDSLYSRGLREISSCPRKAESSLSVLQNLIQVSILPRLIGQHLRVVAKFSSDIM